MKLCIIKPDGSNAEILLNERQSSFEKVNNELLFFENYFYKIIICEDEAVSNVELYIGDYSIPLAFNSITCCFETDKILIFEGCFDLVCVSVFIEDNEGKENTYYTDYFRVATTKQTARQVEQMLAEIESNLPNFLEICFSRSRKKAGLIKNDVRSIWNTLKIIDEIIGIYDDNYGYFCNHKKSSVEQVASIVDVKAMRRINQDSLRWIVSNPDNLNPTDKGLGVSVNGKKYFPAKIKSLISQYSYNVYENRIVLGFLKNVIDYVDNQISGFEKEISELGNIPEAIALQIPNTHELTGRCIYIYYKGVMEKFLERMDLLQEIYYKYECILHCVPESVQAAPRLTNTFKQIYHYRVCYECMVKWFEAGDYSFEHLNYLFKLKTLSRIFEYYCLIKLQTAIVQNGYSFKEANRIVYDLENEEEDINNQYIFTGQSYELTLLYEPSIWVDKFSNGINLYSTGYNFLKSKWNDRWTPDFVLKISDDFREYYFILDAKYSNERNVKKRHIPNLVLKYGTQIASKDKFFSDVIGIGAIYPSTEDKMYYFKKNGVHSQRQSLPKYFSLAVVGEKIGNLALKIRISSLLNLVEVIEREERTNMVASNEINSRFSYVIDDSRSISETTDNCAIEVNTNMQIKEKSIAESRTKEIVERVNGKKCFYYAKGMCLHKKGLCSIVNAPCDQYIYKSSKELLKEEDTCRNFIRYMRRGKVDKVECLISGLQGCVGTDNCKFCLKKNKSKQAERIGEGI